jgi:hypothetical protein
MKHEESTIVESAAAYEKWLEAQLDGEIFAGDLEEKHKKMTKGAFQFLRATYWRWAETIFRVCPELEDAPSVLAVGDIHIENFGSWRDREGRLVWGVNDFDEAAKMPYVLDLVRLATSAVLADVPGMPVGRICTYVLEGYREGLDDPKPFVLDRQHEWLREKVVVPEDARTKFWDKFDPEKNGNNTKKNGKRRKIPRRYVKALMSARPDAGFEFIYWPRFGAGTGSLGRPRWIGYGLWQSAPIVREAKGVVRSGWARCHNGSHRLRCVEIAAGRYRSPDPWYDLRGNILVRRLSPNDAKLELPSKKEEADRKKLSKPPDLVNRQMLAAMGRDLAAVHLGTADRRKAIAGDLDGRPRGWLGASVAAAAEFVRGEHQEWMRS